MSEQDVRLQEALADPLAAARAHLEAGRPEAAVPLLEELVRQEPGNAPALQDLARAWRRTGRIAAAARAARQALEIDPSLVHMHGVVAWAALTQGRYDEAETALRTMLEGLSETDTAGRAAVLNQIAVVFFRRKRYDEAADLLDQALELDPKSATLRFNLAMLYWQDRQYDEAGRELERLLALSEMPPDIAFSAHVNLGHIYARQGRYDDARAQFAGALAVRRAFMPRLYQALPFLARFSPRALLIVVLIVALIVWNVVRLLI